MWGRMAKPDIETIRKDLTELRGEHRELDDEIASMAEEGAFDQLEMQRLKKRKLVLKDEIATLESKLVPDIIA